MHLPKKEIGITAGILLLATIGGAIVFLLNKKETPNIIRQKSINDIIINLASSSSKNSKFIGCPEDRDCDGLKDADEKNWQTDPDNPDTDGDGYLDGEETVSGYHPLVKAPNDKIEPVIQSSRPMPQNLTLAFSSKLSNLVNAGEIPFGGTAQDPGDISQKALDNISAIFDEADLNTDIYFMVTKKDLELPNYNTLTRDNPEEYLKKLAIALEYQDPRRTKMETEILSNIIGNPEITKEIPLLISNYQQITSKLKQIIPPKKLEENHYQFIKISASLAKVFSALENAENDPLKSVLAISKYMELLNQSEALLRNFAVNLDPK